MSIDKITSKIIKEAEENKAEVLLEAKQKSDAILEEVRLKAEEILKVEEAKGHDAKDKIICRRKSVADIDCRKVVLQKKQELISQ